MSNSLCGGFFPCREYRIRSSVYSRPKIGEIACIQYLLSLIEYNPSNRKKPNIFSKSKIYNKSKDQCFSIV